MVHARQLHQQRLAQTSPGETLPWRHSYYCHISRSLYPGPIAYWDLFAYSDLAYPIPTVPQGLRLGVQCYLCKCGWPRVWDRRTSSAPQEYWCWVIEWHCPDWYHPNVWSLRHCDENDLGNGLWLATLASAAEAQHSDPAYRHHQLLPGQQCAEHGWSRLLRKRPLSLSLSRTLRTPHQSRLKKIAYGHMILPSLRKPTRTRCGASTKRISTRAAWCDLQESNFWQWASMKPASSGPSMLKQHRHRILLSACPQLWLLQKSAAS